MTKFKTGHTLIKDAETLKGYVKRVNPDLVFFDTESRGLDWGSPLFGISLYDSDSDPVFVAVNNVYYQGCVSLKDAREILNPLFSKMKGVAHNAKYDLWVLQQNGFAEISVEMDTMLAIHAFNPDLRKKLETRLAEDIGWKKKTFEEVIGKKWDRITWGPEELLKLLAEYSCEDVYGTKLLYDYYVPKITELKLLHILKDIEIPLCYVLRDMKERGVFIDVPLLEKMEIELGKRIGQIKLEIFDKAGCMFNMNSSKQKAEVLYDKLGYECTSLTTKGGRSTDVAALQEMSNNGSEVATLLIEYSGYGKLQSTYVQGIPTKLDSDGRLRGDLNSAGARTGRMCIEENQLVTTVGGSVPIKDIVVGDFVYCYDNKGVLRIRKVLSVYCKGNKDLVKLTWVSSGNHKVGSLLCTPDHKVKTVTRGWVEAEKLLPKDKLYHLVRRPHKEGGKERPRLYGTHSFQEKEQETIKKQLLLAPANFIAHHKDEDTSNNTCTNIKIMSRVAHSRLHGELLSERGNIKYAHLQLPENRATPTYGEDNPKFIKHSRFTLLRLLITSGGKLTGVPMDFQTYKDKCKLSGINLGSIGVRFNTKGEFLSRGRILQTINMTSREAKQHLAVGFYSWKLLIDYCGVTNHKVVSVIPFGEGVVYDIEVEELNNFIASEICVHNSSSNPNLQNQPNNKEFPVRKAFRATEGHSLICADWSQIELRIMAHASMDENLVRAFLSGEDIHAFVARQLGITRKGAKTVNFGIMYGMGPDSLAALLGISPTSSQRLLDDYHHKYAGFTLWKNKIERFAKANGYVRNPFGRIRLLPDAHRGYGAQYSAALRQATNTYIQGGAADLMKICLIEIGKRIQLQKLAAYPLLVVHDEFLVEVANSVPGRYYHVEEAYETVINIMEKHVKLRVPVVADGKLCTDWSQMKDENFVSILTQNKNVETYLNYQWLQ